MVGGKVVPDQVLGSNQCLDLIVGAGREKCVNKNVLPNQVLDDRPFPHSGAEGAGAKVSLSSWVPRVSCAVLWVARLSREGGNRPRLLASVVVLDPSALEGAL